MRACIQMKKKGNKGQFVNLTLVPWSLAVVVKRHGFALA
jgi:hypothetical protein